MTLSPHLLTRRRFAAMSLGLLCPGVTAARAAGVADAAPAAWSPPLAGEYRPGVDVSRCLVSEKYDGVRALWDGRVLRHRSGREVAAPAAWLARLPGVPLDGELWLGRGTFDALSALVRRERPDAASWRAVQFMVFDLPGAPGPFSARAGRTLDLVAAAAPGPAVAVAHSPVADAAALARRLRETVALGGEGLMLHVASAPWAGGRSAALMKVKPQFDAEARVVGHRLGQGRNRGRLGALEVETAGGRRFLLGSGFDDAERTAPPAIGSMVTFRFRSVSPAGTPRFATYWRPYTAF